MSQRTLANRRAGDADTPPPRTGVIGSGQDLVDEGRERIVVGDVAMDQSSGPKVTLQFRDEIPRPDDVFQHLVEADHIELFGFGKVHEVEADNISPSRAGRVINHPMVDVDAVVFDAWSRSRTRPCRRYRSLSPEGGTAVSIVPKRIDHNGSGRAWHIDSSVPMNASIAMVYFSAVMVEWGPAEPN